MSSPGPPPQPSWPEDTDVSDCDLGQRLASNPILTNRDVAPSHPSLEVVSVFNAAAAQVGDETVLLLRIAERPRSLKGAPPAHAQTLDPWAPGEGLSPLPPGVQGENLVGLTYLDTTREPP